jgi:rhodanese-related sulfurtransferase
VITADDRLWQSVRVLRPTKYQKPVTAKDIEALRVQIPDGTEVLTADPEYRSLNLTYRGGNVVRQVDGASLDQVIAEERSGRSWLFVGGAAVAAAVAAVVVLVRRLRRPPAAGISDVRMTGLWVLAAVGIAPAPVAAGPPFPIVVVTDPDAANDRYCGLYCIHEAGRLTGRTVDWDRLIRAENLRGAHGSNVEDLLNCCREFGIPHSYTANASYADLWLLDGPAIVLVKNSPTAREANHWVMVLAADAGSAKVYDPSVGVVRVPAAEIQAVIGGPVIAVFNSRDGSGTVWVWTAARVLLVAAGLGLTVVVLRGLARAGVPPALGLGAAVLMPAAVAHVAMPSGFVNNRGVIAEMVSARNPRTPGAIRPAEVWPVAPSDVVFVDSRTPSQFAAVRIPGAINIPYLGPHFRNRQVADGLRRDAHIVIYCNSASCPWARALAASPVFHEFPHVSVLTDGLEGYTAVGGKALGRP